jgi:hypothetical protein
VPDGDAVVTENYGEAGALQRYTSLPVFSGHNGYGLWAVPPGSVTAVTVGLDRRLLTRLCVSTSTIGHVTMPVDNDENGTELAVCTPRLPWTALWSQVRRYG